MNPEQFNAGEIVRHVLFIQSNHMMVIRKLGESTYGCRYYQGGQLLYAEFESFELERVANASPINPGDLIVAS